MRQVRELKTGGFEKRRYVQRHAWKTLGTSHDSEELSYVAKPTFPWQRKIVTVYGGWT